LTEEIKDMGLKNEVGPFWQQYRCVFGWVAQTCYVCVTTSCSLLRIRTHISFCSGAQVGVASLAVNFLTEQGIGIDHAEASRLFSYCQMTFTAGRFISVLILNFVDPALLLSLYGFMCTAFSLGVSLASSRAGVGCLFGLFFFESICYPVSDLLPNVVLR
jgi:MFS transporter, FHS family, L-fucose permease